MGDCLGCEQQAYLTERSFDEAFKKAQEYANQQKADFVVYMEFKEWKIIRLDKAAECGIFHWRQPVAHAGS